MFFRYCFFVRKKPLKFMEVVMKQIKNLSFILFLSTLFVFVAVNAPIKVQAKETKHIKFSTWHPPNSSEVKKVFIPMLEELKKRSDGRITYTMYAGGSLGAGPDHYDIVKDGISDMGYFTATWTPGRFPLTDVLSMSVWVEGKDTSVDIGNAMYERILKKEYPGVKMIELNGCINSFIWTKKKINNFSDLKGMRIACPGGMRCEYLKATGASVVFMPGTDFYMSMQTGTIDGLVTCPPILNAFKLNEVVTNGVIAPLGCVGEGIIMNQESWDKTPEDLKPLIQEVCSNPYRTSGGLTDAEYHAMMHDISESGVELSYVQENPEQAALWYSAFQNATMDWIDVLEKDGLPAIETVKHYYYVTKEMDIKAPGIPEKLIQEWEKQ
jgi:TRAP-type C4-dicarboxylate transport system substrate-binding protein